MPKSSPCKTEWDLGLLYASESDPQIENDVVRTETLCADFEHAYKGKDLSKDKRDLLSALQKHEALVEEISGAKPYMYFAYRKALQGSDKKAAAVLAKLHGRYSSAHNRILFFEIGLGKLPEKLKTELLADPLFKEYRYYLERIFLEAKHRLGEEAERALSLMSLPAYTMWVDAIDRVLSGKTVRHGRKTIPLAEAQSILGDLPLRARRRLQKELNAIYKEVAEFAEDEINAVVTNKKIHDELRGFKTPVDATILNYENAREAVDNMLQAVTESYRLSHRFYKLKAKLMKLPHLTYAEKSASIGKIKRPFTWEKGVEIVADAFAKAKPAYGDLLREYARKGQIDVYPKKGKEGGAFCSSASKMPTFILLNYVNNLDSVSALAHEMGHAIHAYLSETSQPPLYQHFTISTAEIASTFFENLAAEALFETLSPKEQLIALHDQIVGDIGTVFRQVAFFRFEERLHAGVRDRGRLSKEEIAELFREESMKQFGPAVKATKDDGYAYVAISHFRRYFYVYTYAYGNLVSRVLLKRFKEDPRFIDKVDSLLRSGRSDTPENLLKKIGVDPTARAFWKEGLEMIERDIERLEKLAALKR